MITRQPTATHHHATSPLAEHLVTALPSSPAAEPDDLSRAFAARDALFARAVMHDPPFVSMQLRALLAGAEALDERDLADPDQEIQAVLSQMGGSPAIVRLFACARRAHHRVEAARLERELLGGDPDGPRGSEEL